MTAMLEMRWNANRKQGRSVTFSFAVINLCIISTPKHLFSLMNWSTDYLLLEIIDLVVLLANISLSVINISMTAML